MALRIPISWLTDYVDISTTPEELAEQLTIAGLEVETIEQIGNSWDEERIFIGQIMDIEPHPNADRLSLVTVDYGKSSPLKVVTGAPNIKQYENNLPSQALKVAFAIVGAQLIDPYHEEGNKVIRLKAAAIRGVQSEGMICSEKELGISDSHEGVIFLPEDAPVGQPLKEYLGDAVLHFDIKGGFSHLLSILGVARETAALTDKPLDKSISLREMPSNYSVVEQPPFVKLDIQNPDLCYRYSALLIRDVKIGPSPFWMQQRLLRAGMRPINNIVDITNYVMLELGQPLHAFDYDLLKQRVNGDIPTIIIRTARDGEKITTLDEIERPLDTQMLMIADANEPIAVAGVMGGGTTEVADNTTNILLESANFEFLNNRRTSHMLKLRTESSERFGKHIDPELTLPAAFYAARLMVEHAGGEIEPICGDLYPRKKSEATIDLSLEYVERLLGIQIYTEEIVRILEALEFQVTLGEPLKVVVPSHRMDIQIPADLVEEIARIHGYNRMPSTLILDELPQQKSNPVLTGIEKIKDILVSAGLDEIITYSITDVNNEARLQLTDEVDLSQFVPLKNPLSQERTHLRRSLLAGALTTANQNLRFQDRITVFEIGSVFHPQSEEILPQEPRRLSVVMTGKRHSASWITGREIEKMDFYDLKGVLEVLFTKSHINDVVWKKASKLPYHPGRCAQIHIDGKLLGYMGELHPKVREGFGLPHQPVCAAELDLDLLLENWEEDHKMHQISAYSPIYEDLALLVDASLPAEMVTPLILKVGKPLLQKAELFDVFEGKQVGKGKKSLAYSLTFQAFDKTLTDKDVEKVRNKIIRRLEHELNVSLRPS